MKTYTIRITITDYGITEVQARNKDEACTKAIESFYDGTVTWTDYDSTVEAYIENQE